MRPILETPERLVDNGKFNFGTYKAPFKLINPLDAQIGLPRTIKRFRLKEWQHFALVNDEVYVSVALFNAKIMALAQICVYDKQKDEVLFYERQVPSWAVKIPRGIWDSWARYKGKGMKLEIHNHLYGKGHELDFYSDPTGGQPPVSGNFTCLEDEKKDEPMVVAMPLGDSGQGMYSHKFVCPITGRMSIADKEYVFDKGSYGLVDIHKGYYPWVMKWHWATCGGTLDGKLVGFNLTDNQVKDQEAYNENCFWIDGKLHLLPPVKFEFDPNDPDSPWKIFDTEGKVDVHFTPKCIRKVDINALVVRSKYRAPFGEFSGKLTDENGKSIEFENHFGMCEDFYLRA
jgi:Domain of unknown function (DUF2804), C-terminal/Domain of unknown function (DUF2804), N-terminal